MKTFYTIIVALMTATLSFSQSNVKIILQEDGIDYASGTATIIDATFNAIGGRFLVVNTSSDTSIYNFAVQPISMSSPNLNFQFCGGGPLGQCVLVDTGIGGFWEASADDVTVAPGDTTLFDAKMGTATQPGTGIARYYVMVPAAKGSSYEKLDSVTVEFTSTVSVDAQPEIPTFKIYPNPTKGGVTVQGESLEKGGIVVFQNALGQEVKRVHLNEMHSMIDVSTLNKGVYFVSIVTKKGTKSKVQRLIIQ